MLQGKQIGTLMKDSENGIQVYLDPIESIKYKRIVNGTLEEYTGFAMYKEIYDTRQGSMVSGIVLCDASGYPMESEHYKVSDFTWSGNVSYGGGTPISFL